MCPDGKASSSHNAVVIPPAHGALAPVNTLPIVPRPVLVRLGPCPNQCCGLQSCTGFIQNMFSVWHLRYRAEERHCCKDIQDAGNALGHSNIWILWRRVQVRKETASTTKGRQGKRVKQPFLLMRFKLCYFNSLQIHNLFKKVPFGAVFLLLICLHIGR